MGTTRKVAKGHAAGKSGQELGLANELALLECIKTEGWIREHEASLITGMSRYMIGVVGRRLEQKGDLFRERSVNLFYAKMKAAARQKAEKSGTPTKPDKPSKRLKLDGNAGYFLRLTASGADRIDGKSGKDIEIPACWKHHAMAIQTLHFLAKVFGCNFETEASIRRRIDKGKIPDGNLVAEHQQYFFEQEHSRKSGRALRKQTETIAMLANDGFICILAYPYPASICGGINHEIRLTNSIRHRWGSPATQNIKLVRCHFDSLVAYHNMHVSRFEMIDLPAMIDTPASRNEPPGVTDQIKGFKWIMHERRTRYSLQIKATLQHNCETMFEGIFTEGQTEDDYHRLESDEDIIAESYAGEVAFSDFVLAEQKNLENQIAGDIRMWEMQKASEAKSKEQPLE